MHYGTRLGHLFQRPQRSPQHRYLTCRISRQAEGQAKGMLDSRDAWHADTRGQFRHHGNRDSAEPGGFDLSLNQSHGPAAHWSNRNQHDRIHLFLAKPANDARNRVTQQHVVPKSIPHV